MKYTAKFRNKYNEMILVIIVTQNNTLQETELTLSGENPVMLSVSSDGIFAPIKSRSCTVTVLTKEPLLDIYSASSHGTTLTVNNLTKEECLFFGYVTPCEYTQSYLYLNELEIEAVDAISTLHDFKYQYAGYSEKYVTVLDIVKKLIQTSGCKGSIYVPRLGNKRTSNTSMQCIPFETEYLNDDIFFSDDDDHEPDDCYSVLEEICNYYGMSCVPYGEDVYFIDYLLVVSGIDNNNIFKNIKSSIDEISESESAYFAIEQTTADAYPALWIDEINGSEADINIDGQGVGVLIIFMHIYGKKITIKNNNTGETVVLNYQDGKSYRFLNQPGLKYTLSDQYGNRIVVDASGDDFIFSSANNPDIVYTSGFKTLAVGIGDSITIDDYAGDDQTVELDEVYNKISVKADVYEVKEDSIGVTYENDLNLATFWRNKTDIYGWVNGEEYTTMCRFFTLLKSGYGGSGSYYNGWIHHYYWNIAQDPNTPTAAGFTGTLINRFVELGWQASWTPPSFTSNMVSKYNYSGWYGFNGEYVNISGLCAIPMQYFSYKSSEEMPYKSEWNDIMCIFTGSYWMYRYLTDSDAMFAFNSTQESLQNYWETLYYNEVFGGNNILLEYESNKYINYTPVEENDTNYLCITGDLLLQVDSNWNDRAWRTVLIDEKNKHITLHTFPFKDAGYSGNEYIRTRRKNDDNYNKGWNLLRLKISIGDKYWNGNEWVGYDSSFYIPYHEKNVLTEDEHLKWNDWNKPVTNHNYTYKIGKDAFVIPINKQDGLYGKLKCSIYLPQVPYANQIQFKNYNYRLLWYNLPPVIFMKDFGITIATVDKSNEWYKEFDDDKDEDDIIYENIISTNNVMEFDDLELKINTYNDKKQLAKSYICVNTGEMQYYTGGFLNSVKHRALTQELNIIDKYLEHYSTPKKIYNCTVHGYKAPYKCMTVSAFDDKTKFIVDEQEYNVKDDINELKLIEY